MRLNPSGRGSKRFSSGKSSAADSFGAQVESERRKKTVKDAFDVQEQEDRPILDTFDEDFDVGGEDDGFAADGLDELSGDFGGRSGAVVAKKASKRARLETSGSSKKKGGRLSLKGNLDSSFEEGKYAATPVDAERAMDDIFGALDEDVDNEVGTAKFKTQDEYEEWFESERMKLEGAHTKNYVADRDQDIMAQITQLREKQEKKVDQDMAIIAGDGGAAYDDEDGGIDESGDDGAALAGQLARDYVDAATSLVQVRLKQQPVFSSAIRLPQGEEVLEAFCNSDAKIGEEAEAVTERTRSVIGALLAAAPTKGESKKKENPDVAAAYFADLDEDAMWSEISGAHSKIMRQADDVVTEWGKKALTAAAPQKSKKGSEGDLQVINRPLIEQIKGVLEGGKLRLLDRTRKNRQHASVFGSPAHHFETSTQRALRIADGDMDTEIYDDVDFLRELVHKNASAQQRVKGADEAAADLELDQELRAAGKESGSRTGLHRLTKGKAINTNPRPKIVGFMAPIPYTSDYTGNVPEGESIPLFNSLFQ